MLVFRDASWPGFLYCLKYSGFGCLRCTDQSFYDIKVNIVRAIESRAERGGQDGGLSRPTCSCAKNNIGYILQELL